MKTTPRLELDMEGIARDVNLEAGRKISKSELEVKSIPPSELRCRRTKRNTV